MGVRREKGMEGFCLLIIMPIYFRSCYDSFNCTWNSFSTILLILIVWPQLTPFMVGAHRLNLDFLSDSISDILRNLPAAAKLADNAVIEDMNHIRLMIKLIIIHQSSGLSLITKGISDHAIEPNLPNSIKVIKYRT